MPLLLAMDIYLIPPCASAQALSRAQRLFFPSLLGEKKVGLPIDEVEGDPQPASDFFLTKSFVKKKLGGWKKWKNFSLISTP